MKREDLNELTLEEVGAKLQESFDVYDKEVKSITDLDTLAKMEDEMIALMKENDEVLKNTKYVLPENVNFEGEVYTKSKVFDKVVYFISKMEVEYSYTLGLYEMTKMWKNASMVDLDYPKFDSTLRTLGQLKYKGASEWRDITIVNQYFMQLKEQYNKDTTFFLYLSKKHNSIMEQMQKLSEPEVVNEECMCENCTCDKK